MFMQAVMSRERAHMPHTGVPCWLSPVSRRRRWQPWMPAWAVASAQGGQKVLVGLFCLAAAGGNDHGTGPGGHQGGQTVIHR